MAVCITIFEPGGQSVVVEETTKRFSKYYDVDLYCCYLVKESPKWLKNVYIVKPWKNKYIPIIDKDFIKEIKERNYDVIHCHDSIPFFGSFVKYNIPFYITCLGMNYWWNRDGIFKKIDWFASRAFYSIGYRNATKVFAISNYLVSWLKETYSVESQVNYLGASLDRFYPGSKDKNQKKFPVLTYFGQISRKKGILDLLKAVTILKKRYPNILLNLCGFGPEVFLEKVKKIISDNDIEDNVHITGYISDEEQIIYYHNCDAAITASYWEGFGLPIIEAYQCNRPIFARNSSAMKELVPDKKFLFGSVDEMVEKISYFVDNIKTFEKKDYTKFVDLSTFDWDKNSEKYLNEFGK